MREVQLKLSDEVYDEAGRAAKAAGAKDTESFVADYVTAAFKRKMGRHYPAFKAYDVRGKVGDQITTDDQINVDLAYRIGRAYADEIKPKNVCVGHDIRLSGPQLSASFCAGLNDAGVDVIDLGMVGTEMIYFATAYYGYDGGVMITASHNPPQYNGFKFVRAESRPISSDTGLLEIERRAFKAAWERSGFGRIEKKDVYDDFIKHLLGVVDPSEIKPLRVLLDVGNGAAGMALEKLLPHLPLQVTKMHFVPDGNFPNGVPNPILPEARLAAENELKKGGYDFGVAWDGDYDRCFFLDGAGTFIEGYYIVGLLAKAILHDQPGQTIIYDPRLTWNTVDIVNSLKGKPVICKSGHAFIKEKMREENAVYGGEMSAHHYFKAHWFCDSGMIPFLLVSRLISKGRESLADMVSGMIRAYPCSGEQNTKLKNLSASAGIIQAVREKYSPGGQIVEIDGLSIEYPEWRFNLRASNTEPEIRLNVESRGNQKLMEEKTAELLDMIRSENDKLG